jgi:hypothetical protein
LARMWRMLRSYPLCGDNLKCYDFYEIVLQFLKILHIELLYDPLIWLLALLPKRNEVKSLKKYLNIYMHSNSLHNRQKVEATQMSINRWMGKPYMEYSGILNLKRKCAIYYDMGLLREASCSQRICTIWFHNSQTHRDKQNVGCQWLRGTVDREWLSLVYRVFILQCCRVLWKCTAVVVTQQCESS